MHIVLLMNCVNKIFMNCYRAVEREVLGQASLMQLIYDNS